ncbi:MAG: DinB family protein [Polyangiales bacterium]
MSPLEQYRALARYNRWMNRKLYRLAFTLDDDTLKRDLGAFFGSIHGTLNHLLLTDRVWMLRFTGDRERFSSRTVAQEPIVITSLAQELYPDFETLHRERERTDEDLLEWAYALDEAALDRSVEYTTTAGETQRHALWWALGHMFNHQTNHRGQAATLLKQLGIDPGSTDLIAMLREEEIPTR